MAQTRRRPLGTCWPVGSPVKSKQAQRRRQRLGDFVKLTGGGLSAAERFEACLAHELVDDALFNGFCSARRASSSCLTSTRAACQADQ